MQDEARKTIDVKQALRILKISRSTLDRLIENGVITPLPKPPYLKRVHKHLFYESDILDMLKPGKLETDEPLLAGVA